MIINNRKITKPVNENDVQYVLSINVGGDWGRMCTSEAIKKWARFKPINVPQIAPLTHSQIAGTTYHFGLNILRASNWNTFKQYLGAYVSMVYGSTQQMTIDGVIYHKGDWEDGVYYMKPDGNNMRAYRITDFVSAENQDLGYITNPQPLPHWPNYSVIAPTAGVLASAINSYIQTDAQGDFIDITQLPDSTEALPDDRQLYAALNIPLTLPAASGSTHNDYNSVTIVELVKAFLGGNTNVKRGLALVDVGGFVSEFNTGDSGYVPWIDWKTEQDEAMLAGEWVCMEYYSTNNGEFILLPTFENKVRFVYGSSPSQATLAFAKDPAIGICLSDHQYQMYISFCQITERNLSDFEIKVSLKNETRDFYAMQDAGLDTFTPVYSGGMWYEKYVNVGYSESPQQSYAGDVFTLYIDYRPANTSVSFSTFKLTNIVLTV